MEIHRLRKLWTMLLATAALVFLQSKFMLNVYQDDVFCGIRCFGESFTSGFWGPIWLVGVVLAVYWLRSFVYWIGVIEFLLGPFAVRLLVDLYEPAAKIMRWPEPPEALLLKFDRFSQVTLWPGLSLMGLGISVALFDMVWQRRKVAPEEFHPYVRRGMEMLGITLLLLVLVPIITSAIRRFMSVHWVPWSR